MYYFLSSFLDLFYFSCDYILIAFLSECHLYEDFFSVTLYLKATHIWASQHIHDHHSKLSETVLGA